MTNIRYAWNWSQFCNRVGNTVKAQSNPPEGQHWKMCTLLVPEKWLCCHICWNSTLSKGTSSGISHICHFYTTTIWGQNMLHMKVRKFAIKVREVFGKRKWRFFMTCQAKGGGCYSDFSIFCLFKNYLESIPDCQNAFCT